MSNKRLVVMMLGGARRVSVAELLQKSGRRLGYDVEIVSYELMREVPIALVGKVVVGLRWSDPEVVDDIERVVEENGVNVILPFVDGAIEIDFEVTSAMFDKVEAAKVFKEAGIHIPTTYSVISAEMPAIAKPRRGSASRGIKVFHNIDDLMHLENLQDYLVQEYIEHNIEYTVDSYVGEDGQILVTVPRKRLEVMGGEVTRTITCHNPELEKMSREVLSKFHFRGPVTLQFLHDLDKDRYLLMEVNPRLGGGVVCSIYAGAPILDYILGEALGVDLKPCDDWTAGTLMARYQKEAIFNVND